MDTCALDGSAQQYNIQVHINEEWLVEIVYCFEFVAVESFFFVKEENNSIFNNKRRVK